MSIIYLYYIILIGIILKFFDGKQITNNIIIQLTLIICVGLFIINLLLPAKNKENFGKGIGVPCHHNDACTSKCCDKDGGGCKSILNMTNCM
jgi:hypothetical protein